MHMSYRVFVKNKLRVINEDCIVVKASQDEVNSIIFDDEVMQAIGSNEAITATDATAKVSNMVGC